MEHTRGPWRISPDGDHGYHVCTADDDQMDIAYVYGENSEVGEADPAVALADAELIAAAPTLLKQRNALRAALEGLFEHCAMIHKHWGDGGNAREADAAINAARAALAKAGGGA